MIEALNLTHHQLRIIETAAADVPAGALDKYRKFVSDVLRGARDPDEDDIRRAVWEASMRYSDPR